MITITSNDYGYIILRDLNLSYKEVGTIEESSLFLSELKSLKSLKDFKRVNISDEDYLKITDRIKFLSIVPGTPEPNLPPMWGSIEGNLNTQLDLFGKLTEIENNTVTNLATVATSGDYEDLTNKPTIPVLPTLATVATSGSYTDLTDKPDLTLKQNSLPTNGTAGQFLAHDLTFKTPVGGDSSSGFNFGSGFQIGKPVKGAYYDNSIFASPLTVASFPLGSQPTDIAFPVVFRETLTIDEISVYGTQAGGMVTLSIYDSLPSEFPYRKQWESAPINVSSYLSAATCDFTFVKNKVYWIRMLVSSAAVILRCVPGTHTLAFASSTFIDPIPASSRANAIIHATYGNAGEDGKYFCFNNGKNSSQIDAIDKTIFIHYSNLPHIDFKVA